MIPTKVSVITVLTVNDPNEVTPQIQVNLPTNLDMTDAKTLLAALLNISYTRITEVLNQNEDLKLGLIQNLQTKK